MPNKPKVYLAGELTGPFSEWKKLLVPAVDLTRDARSVIRTFDQERFIFTGPILIIGGSVGEQNVCNMQDIGEADLVFSYVETAGVGTGRTLYEVGYSLGGGKLTYITFPSEAIRSQYPYIRGEVDLKTCLSRNVRDSFFAALDHYQSRPQPVDETPAEPRHPVMDSDLEFTLQIGHNLLDILPNLPEPAEEFAESVEAKAESIMASIERTGRVTPNQTRALSNMYEGAKKWLH